MIALSVNLNKVALLRNSRTGNHPSVLEFAELALKAGAQGLTVHPRPDGRHIRDQDVDQLCALIQHWNSDKNLTLETGRKPVEFNIEGNPFKPASKGSQKPQGAYSSYAGLLAYAVRCQPDQVTLVPDGDGQLTSDHGFDLKKDRQRVEASVKEFGELGIRVSLFMDPDLEQIKLAKAIGADRIELYTGPYAWAQTPKLRQEIYQRHFKAAEYAASIGLGVNAGHDLDLNNLELYRELPGLQEVSIGHALTVDALRFGWTASVEKYVALLGP